MLSMCGAIQIFSFEKSESPLSVAPGSQPIFLGKHWYVLFKSSCWAIQYVDEQVAFCLVVLGQRKSFNVLKGSVQCKLKGGSKVNPTISFALVLRRWAVLLYFNLAFILYSA
jgi:hypothetical protein